MAVSNLGPSLVFHTFEGILLVMLGIASVVLAFKLSPNRLVRISAMLDAFALVRAAMGGFLFVMSRYSAGGASAQMGGSFIRAYSFYIIDLYYAK